MSNPARVLEALNRKLPRGAWERIDRRRAAWVAQFGAPDKEVAWWYYEPLMEACLDEMEADVRKAIMLNDVVTASLLSSLPTLVNWRMTRGIYEFDQELRSALFQTEIDRLPTDILRRLPEYAPYLVLDRYDYAGVVIVGAWVMRTASHTNRPEQINAVLHTEDDQAMAVIMDLTGETLEECLRATISTVKRDADAAHRQGLHDASLVDYQQESLHADLRLWSYLLSLMLYLCSEEPDIQGRPLAPAYSPKRKYAHVTLPPQKDNILKVGYAYGGAIRMWRQSIGESRQSDSSGLGMPKAPHIRRAHFALRWSGKGRTIPKIVWIAPTAVNVKNLDDMPAYVRPVLDDPGEDRNADATWARDNGAVLDRLK